MSGGPGALATALLAAGASRRMRGRDKLLEPVAPGLPVLRHLAQAALDAGAGPVAVTLRAPDPARAAALQGLTVTILPVPDAAEGMAASLRQAAGWARRIGAAGLILCPADMPALQAEDFAALVARYAAAGPPLRAAAANGRPGHPVLFPSRFFDALAGLRGDSGARGLLLKHPPELVPRPGLRAVTDLDTPEDWARWREGS